MQQKQQDNVATKTARQSTTQKQSSNQKSKMQNIPKQDIVDKTQGTSRRDLGGDITLTEADADRSRNKGTEEQKQ